MVAFLFAVILSGAVSASSVHFSSDGKNISITHKYVNSTLKTYVTAKKGYGDYGYGLYTTVTTSGKDNEGRNSIETLYSFNGKPKQMISKLWDSDSSVNGVTNFYNTRFTTTITGKDSFTDETVKATGVGLYRNIAGQKYVSNTTVNLVCSINGKIFAKATQFTTYQYKAFNGVCNYVKTISTTDSTYAVGLKKKSVINSYYTRNSAGTLTGLKISGTSRGTETINNKRVSFTGKITISTRHDAKDIFSEGFTRGDYKEVLTSSSPTLLKLYPMEA